MAPHNKRDVMVRLQLLRAGEAVPAQRSREVLRAYELAKTSAEVVEAACSSRVRVLVAADVVAGSDQPNAASDRLLACGIESNDHEFIKQILPMVKDINQPNVSMHGERPVCSAVGQMDPIVFGTLLKAKPDVVTPCGDGKTVREQLAERATRPHAEPSFRKAAADMLQLLEGQDDGR
ncbi:MAG: hypothetical protein IPK27_20105 [Rhodanobacteraceae bacterium]|nr:hypothetical protein [Rhodanobacteraceae bacterium]